MPPSARIALLLCGVAVLPAHAAPPPSLLAPPATPPGWSTARSARCLTLSPPEHDARILLVTPAATTAERALAAAWAACGATPPAQATASPLAPTDGWDGGTEFAYASPEDSRLDTRAIAWRRGGAWAVAIATGAAATQARRTGEFDSVMGGLRPAGVPPETLAGRAPHPLDAARIAALTGFVREGMAQLGVPGAALALIDHGRVVYEGGIGVRALGGAPADAHTRFMIGSNTKGMTTLLLAALVDRGRLSWTRKAHDADPSFRLGSAAATAQAEVRHLVCACTGMKRRDVAWFVGGDPASGADTVYRRLAESPPTTGFGQVYQYSNDMAAAAGYVAAHVLYPELPPEEGYARAMRELVFGPLGMTETGFEFAAALAADHALPHATDAAGRVVPIDVGLNRLVLPLAPAGAAWSTAHDMARYVQNELTAGAPDGTRLFSAANVLKRREPGVPTGAGAFYGMGLVIQRRAGIQVINHGGAVFGYRSDFVVLPDQGVGAVLLTNAQAGGELLDPFARRLLEVLFDARPEAAATVATAASRLALARAAAARDTLLPPPAAVSARLAPAYANPSLGRIAVRRQAGRLFFGFRAWSSEMAARRADTGTFVTVAPGMPPLAFTLSPGQGKAALVLRDEQDEYVFSPVL